MLGREEVSDVVQVVLSVLWLLLGREVGAFVFCMEGGLVVSIVAGVERLKGLIDQVFCRMPLRPEREFKNFAGAKVRF